jgi:alpha-amylase
MPLAGARAEAMLELFQVNWGDLIAKMPEIAEAGYTSLWLPPPAKAGSGYSVGYDVFDAFDLGDKNQRGTTATKYGTKAQLLQMVETAHRFGIRVYFDNVMNHRGFDVPGYNSGTPANLYPGLLPKDFHLQTISGGFYRNWPGVQDYGNQWDVQYESLSGLIDLATEPGSVNGNYGNTLGSATNKISFVRQAANPDYYMDPGGPPLGGPWRPFNGTNGVPVSEDVNSYLIRAVMWTLYTTKCDGFRLDAVKHVPSGFFGDITPTFNGYTGGI